MKECVGGLALVFTKPNENINPLITRNFPDLLPLFRGFNVGLFENKIMVGRFDIKFTGGSTVSANGIRSA